ncbi:hypothetical protein NDU88_002413 [Pleurodeles waltl]|uniref:Uncharacterized protein n=1 Tax=Pleurodeles waltl TaxID=8319 RepID=A0AAV7M836_PLEWA|nr:hypothetical protein NDU88_002413 [Pleurodeles waltl]
MRSTESGGSWSPETESYVSTAAAPTARLAMPSQRCAPSANSVRNTSSRLQFPRVSASQRRKCGRGCASPTEGCTALVVLSNTTL